MNVQHQIAELKHQLDSVYQIVERLQDNLPESAKLSAENLGVLIPEFNNEMVDLNFIVGENTLQHKDVLFDETDPLEGHPAQEKVITPEIQVRRLTAQLTVAYKRIAQLEEQLLSRQGIHNGSEYIYS
ncbi:MAG: hypothetical protein WBB82_05420 [Limnothrix sp.]